MNCKYCERNIANKGSLVSHELCCKSNPDRIQHIRGANAGAKKGSIPWCKGIKLGPSLAYRKKFPNDLIFSVDSKTARHTLKRRILEDNLIEYKCAICNIGPFWNNKPMVLILDHINGINNDSRLSNLRFVCSNCDSQLVTYKSRNRKNK
jgi:hypothetical protein